MTKFVKEVLIPLILPLIIIISINFLVLLPKLELADVAERKEEVILKRIDSLRREIQILEQYQLRCDTIYIESNITINK